MTDTGPDYPPQNLYSVYVLDQSGDIIQDNYGASILASSAPELEQIPFDIWLTIISQYANSPILTTIIQCLAQNIDQTNNLICSMITYGTLILQKAVAWIFGAVLLVSIVFCK